MNQRVVLLRSHIESLHSENEDHKASNGRLTELSEEAREISNGISQLSHQLHSSALDILGLQPALRGLARDLSLAYDLKIEFASVSVMIPMTPDVALCLFRVAQESPSNVIKHSGASWAEVSLSCEGHPKSIRLSVTDNGHGFDPSSLQADSLGIISMRERLRLVDGELTMNSSPGRGTEVVARVRLTETMASAADP